MGRNLDDTPASMKTLPQSRRGFIILTVVCVVLGVLFIVLQIAFRSSGLFKVAVDAVQTDESVIAALGEPLDPGMLITGNLSLGTLSSGNLNFSVVGPRGSGRVSVAGLKGNAEWKILFLEVLVHDSGELVTVKVDDD